MIVIFSNNLIIYGNNEETKAIEVKKTIINNLKFNKEYSNEQIKSISLKNRSVTLIIEGEELFIKNIIIPKVSKRYIYYVLRNEITERYGEDVMFSYDIVKEDKNHYNTVVYCFQENKYSLLKNSSIYNCSGLTIDFIQNSVKDLYSKEIKDKKYILLFNYRNYIYLLKVKNNILIYNKVINLLNYNYDEINDMLKIFIEKNKNNCNIYSINLKEYLQNVDNTELSSLTMKKILEYAVVR
ncbi:MAG: hypothetical protein KID00_05035 [Clostridium argentinense]|uniref:hypothetical protein n=1 Tax=Clostridium butanoliproducens TaxID=2991837 RepID=UPI001DC1F9D1|nr:hypothetical protein [Clostridium butanoliproducens]MBS5823215.1 hypothetical protein [Clostridium argentinense]MDU1349009.1 hypothetical protein [Clostridium argentinense]